jgi:hypothetical protein
VTYPAAVHTLARLTQMVDVRGLAAFKELVNGISEFSK